MQNTATLLFVGNPNRVDIKMLQVPYYCFLFSIHILPHTFSHVPWLLVVSVIKEDKYYLSFSERGEFSRLYWWPNKGSPDRKVPMRLNWNSTAFSTNSLMHIVSTSGCSMCSDLEIDIIACSVFQLWFGYFEWGVVR